MKTQQTVKNHDQYHCRSYEQKLLTATCLIMILASLFSIYFQINAQNQSASVSAVVLPNEFNTRPKKQKNFFERMTLSQKITTSTITGFIVSGSILTYLLATSARIGAKKVA